MPTRKRTSDAGASGRQADFVAAVGRLLNEINALGFEPTLVGGMALVALGSRRVTRDFDFLVVEDARGQQAFVRVFYRHGFELVSKTDVHGNVTRTIDNEEVACLRLRIDRPKSAHFYHHGLGLKVDVLFDFPIGAGEVRLRSTRRKIESYTYHIAATEDLIRMKEVAARDRRSSADPQDLEFLKNLR